MSAASISPAEVRTGSRVGGWPRAWEGWLAPLPADLVEGNEREVKNPLAVLAVSEDRIKVRANHSRVTQDERGLIEVGEPEWAD